MRRVFDIGQTDFRLFLKRKSAYVWLFVVPLVFVYFIGFVSRGPGNPYNRTPPVRIENADTNFLGRAFLDELSAQRMWVLEPTNRDTPASVIRIPSNFTQNARSLTSTRIGFEAQENPGEADSMLSQARVIRALVAMNGHLLEAAGESGGLASLTEARWREIRGRPDPVRLEARFAGTRPVPSGFNFSLPGILVMYVMMNLLIFGGTTIGAERRSGVLRRLAVSPLARLEIVMGKICGLTWLGMAQIGFFLFLGKVAFGVNLGANLPGVLLVLLVFAWVAASLGVLAGCVSTAEDRVAGICVLISLVMAAVGGCWWPLEIGPPFLKTLALCTPSGWALQALHLLISFGRGFDAIELPLLALAGFGLAANLLAARFFRT